MLPPIEDIGRCIPQLLPRRAFGLFFERYRVLARERRGDRRARDGHLIEIATRGFKRRGHPTPIHVLRARFEDDVAHAAAPRLRPRPIGGPSRFGKLSKYVLGDVKMMVARPALRASIL